MSGLALATGQPCDLAVVALCAGLVLACLVALHLSLRPSQHR